MCNASVARCSGPLKVLLNVFMARKLLEHTKMFKSEKRFLKIIDDTRVTVPPLAQVFVVWTKYT